MHHLSVYWPRGHEIVERRTLFHLCGLECDVMNVTLKRYLAIMKTYMPS